MKFGKPTIAVIAIIAVATGIFFFMRAGDDSIEYNGYRIPLDQLRLVDPHPGCEHAHYHAAQVDSVSATDGTVLIDSTDCGFGPIR